MVQWLPRCILAGRALLADIVPHIVHMVNHRRTYGGYPHKMLSRLLTVGVLYSPLRGPYITFPELAFRITRIATTTIRSVLSAEFPLAYSALSTQHSALSTQH